MGIHFNDKNISLYNIDRIAEYIEKESCKFY